MSTSLFHTSEVLRKHQLLVKQEGFGEDCKLSIVDWETREPASEERENKYLSQISGGAIGEK
jgi:hypothetical protein